MNPYLDLAGFADLVLEESYVLGIRAEPGVVTVDADLVLTPSHPAYERPPSDQHDAFKRGRIRFTGVRRLIWDGQGATPAVDADGVTDLGHIDSMEWTDGRFRLEGDWGRMEIEARDVDVRLLETTDVDDQLRGPSSTRGPPKPS